MNISYTVKRGNPTKRHRRQRHALRQHRGPRSCVTPITLEPNVSHPYKRQEGHKYESRRYKSKSRSCITEFEGSDAGRQEQMVGLKVNQISITEHQWEVTDALVKRTWHDGQLGHGGKGTRAGHSHPHPRRCNSELILQKWHPQSSAAPPDITRLAPPHYSCQERATCNTPITRRHGTLPRRS